MDFTSQWGWVFMAYTIAFTVLVVYAVSIAVRISRARERLNGPEPDEAS